MPTPSLLILLLNWYTVIEGDDIYKEERGDMMVVVVHTDNTGETMKALVHSEESGDMMTEDRCDMMIMVLVPT